MENGRASLKDTISKSPRNIGANILCYRKYEMEISKEIKRLFTECNCFSFRHSAVFFFSKERIQAQGQTMLQIREKKKKSGR